MLEPLQELQDIRKTGVSESYLQSLDEHGSYNSNYFSATPTGIIGRSRKILSGVFHRDNKNVTLIYYREDA